MLPALQHIAHQSSMLCDTRLCSSRPSPFLSHHTHPPSTTTHAPLPLEHSPTPNTSTASSPQSPLLPTDLATSSALQLGDRSEHLGLLAQLELLVGVQRALGLLQLLDLLQLLPQVLQPLRRIALTTGTTCCARGRRCVRRTSLVRRGGGGGLRDRGGWWG